MAMVSRVIKNRWFLFIPLLILAVQFALSMSGLAAFGRENDFFNFSHEILLIFVGIYIFFYGFSQIRKKRLIENTPTSKVRSVAMGLNEVVGFAKEKYPLKSSLTSSQCVYYRFKVEREAKDSKGRKHWQVIREGNSTLYFYIEDTTGKLLVDPLDAETMLVVDYQNIEGSASFAGHRIRNTEWLIKPGDYMYILGTVNKFKDNIQVHREKLVEKLRKLKEDKERLKAFDTDGDGQISVEEWDKAREKMEQELLEEELKKPAEAEDDIVIGKGDSEKTFIISDRDEQDIARKLTYRSIGGVLGGGSIIFLMFVSLIARAGLLPAYLKIPWEAFYR